MRLSPSRNLILRSILYQRPRLSKNLESFVVVVIIVVAVAISGTIS